MLGLRAYLYGAVFLAVLGAAGYVYYLSATVDRQRLAIAAHEARIAALTLERDQSAMARAVADARAAASEAKAKQYDTLRERILRDENDVDLPDSIRNALECLRSGGQDGVCDPESTGQPAPD